ncbi:MAG TPA: type II toxin-antitoxin system VapB family antitoxin [Candidatus Angelobacter sp.]|nr:type II toxin-antitoxin system VapB family antitoxin [Candidatus Angelobacter sp.]
MVVMRRYGLTSKRDAVNVALRELAASSPSPDPGG